MKILTINTTFKVADENLIPFENQLRDVVDVISFSVIPDTDNLYNNNEHFRKLIKDEKLARMAKMEYINNHNVDE